MSAPAEEARTLTTLGPPRRVWWGRLGPDERIWLTVAFVWCLIMFTAMVLWQGRGEQRIPVESYKVDEQVFVAEVNDFIASYEIGEEAGVPLVAPEPGGDAYIHASQFAFRPVLQLKRGETYRLLISSSDVQHGLSVHFGDRSYNFQVLPGYLYVVRLTPQETGEFSFICNEFCGIGHHAMTGRFFVVD